MDEAVFFVSHPPAVPERRDEALPGQNLNPTRSALTTPAAGMNQNPCSFQGNSQTFCGFCGDFDFIDAPDDGQRKALANRLFWITGALGNIPRGAKNLGADSSLRNAELAEFAKNVLIHRQRATKEESRILSHVFGDDLRGQIPS